MEKTLRGLFDYQKFAGNLKLQAVIDAAHRQPRELSLEEADFVNAAYGPDAGSGRDEKKDPLWQR
ncbi:MAG: hypothetical protein IJ231_09290 [Clostridia bacterium]|nr:hypothetical protein [Clostridia bacterium]